MEQTPDKRAHLVTTLFESLADSPDLLGDVKDNMVATVLKKLRDNAKELKQENVMRKHENQNTWNAATQTFDSVIDHIKKITTDIENLKRDVDKLYETGARHATADVGDPHTHALSLSLRVAACCAVGDKSIKTAALDGDPDGVEREASAGSSSSSTNSSSNKSMRIGN